MTIDLSSAPPKCTHCVLGKQTCSPVPKIREGPKATKQLERVFVDLCGPMPCVSRTGHLYAMHVIDDFSSYVWSLPLRSKGDASSVFQLWHKHVTTQTNLPLKCLVTDNGELVSKSMHEWCQSLGINHTVTAPYTSAQNGRAKRVHRTVLGKARAMRLHPSGTNSAPQLPTSPTSPPLPL
jgi:transposase InsO family protein